MNNLENAFFKNMNLRNHLQLNSSKNKEHVFKTNLKTCIIKNIISGNENFNCYEIDNKLNHLIKDTVDDINKTFSNLKVENEIDYYKFKVNYNNNIPTNEIGLSDKEKQDLIIYSEKLYDKSKNHKLTRKQLEQEEENLYNFSDICSNIYVGNNFIPGRLTQQCLNFFNSILQEYKIVSHNGFGNDIEKK